MKLIHYVKIPNHIWQMVQNETIFASFEINYKVSMYMGKDKFIPF